MTYYGRLAERAHILMTKYDYSRHPKNRMRWFRMSSEDVNDIIENPDVTTPSILGRTNAWREMESDWIRVTWILEGDVTVVVSMNRDEDGPK